VNIIPGHRHTALVGLYQDQVLPRIMNVVLNDAELASVRARVAAGLAGEILEVGFGSGLNVPLYPRAVTRARAVDPATVGRKLAAGRVAASPVPIEYVGLDAQALPLAAGTIDHVLVTWTLCTIPAVDAALREMYRVLHPGGQLHFAEHGRSADPDVAKWQDRLTPLQRHMAGGCHLNRRIDRLIADAGFSLTLVDTYYMKGFKPMVYTFEGLATKE
jgi:ubiquinone/menaquinone biosynthesis C-methylase UbiE